MKAHAGTAIAIVAALALAAAWGQAEWRARSTARWTHQVLDSLATTVDFPVVPPGLTRSDSLYWVWTATVAKVQARGWQTAMSKPWTDRAVLFDETERVDLVRAGLVDPVRELRDSLIAHPELIPAPAQPHVGTMAFKATDEIVILPGGYVWAPFDDGHVTGSMLLEYRVAPGPAIQWSVLWSRYD